MAAQTHPRRNNSDPATFRLSHSAVAIAIGPFLVYI